MSKKIVLFADGTGNAFTTQESNVWRLYQALDQSQPDQISFYIKGVGTSGFRPFAMLDGATGVGVPSNVRKLYRFLCWNWEKDDEIYLFGFSRGSFTIRTLVGLIDSQGLVPTEIDGDPVTHAEMKRNAAAAWHTYRAETIPWHKSLPTIWVARAIRDICLGIFHTLLRHRPYSKVTAARDAQSRRKIALKFLGLFDTVEAFGVPVEELRTAIDWAIWPISFRNRRLSDRVENARHALSLDDERTTFHPIRIEQDATKPARIKEIWFAGVHSDVGGGYPDNALEHVPLVWMAEEAELAVIDAAGNRIAGGVRFLPGAIASFRNRASPYGNCHDSRSGLGVFYRYSPRVISSAKEYGGPPVIHHSVAEKMVFGSEHYAPITVPDTTLMLMPNGTTHAIRGFPTRLALAPPSPAEQAVAKLHDPDKTFVELTRDTIWWRRVAYFLLLLGALAVLSLPVTAAWIADTFNVAMTGLTGLVGLEAYWNTYWNWAHSAEQGVSSNLDSVSRTIGGFLPSYLRAWIDVLVAKPVASITVALIFLYLYRTNDRLRDNISDRAHQAWFSHIRASRKAHAAKSADPAKGNWALRFARFIRTSRFFNCMHHAATRWVVPGVFLFLIFVLTVTWISRTTVTYRAAQEIAGSAFCHSTKRARPAADGVTVIARPFTPDALCWPSGLLLEKGRQYTLWIEMTEPFFDRTIVADIAGFGGNWMQTLGLPFRRWWIAEWFQPIARIGASGNVEWPLKPVDGIEPRSFGISRAKTPMAVVEVPEPAGMTGMCDPIPAKNLPAAQAIHRHQDVNRTLVSQFTALADGELFLYVNDTIGAIPFGPTIACFYRNNSGAARVTLEKMPVPRPPAAGRP